MPWQSRFEAISIGVSGDMMRHGDKTARGRWIDAIPCVMAAWIMTVGAWATEPAETDAAVQKIDVLLTELYPEMPPPALPADGPTTLSVSPVIPPIAEIATTKTVLIVHLPTTHSLPLGTDRPTSPAVRLAELGGTTQTLVRREDHATTAPLLLPVSADLVQRLTATPPPPPAPPDLPTAPGTTGSSETPGRMVAPKPPVASMSHAVRINQASEAELAARLKLDARRARLIVEFRQLYGPFRNPADLAQVNGITDDMIRAWERANLLFFERKNPIHPRGKNQ